MCSATSLSLNFLCDVWSQLYEQIKASTVSVDRLHRMRSIILPPVLEADYEVAAKVETIRMSFTKRDNSRYVLEFTFQHSNISNFIVIFSRLSARYLDNSHSLDTFSISSIFCSNWVASIPKGSFGTLWPELELVDMKKKRHWQFWHTNQIIQSCYCDF